ncbi:hypothetical protein J7M00_06865, partial [bacterium]|nr:hypothetical protein [bacterium]
MGVISKINSLRGVARDNYIKKWKVYVVNQCRKRGISLHQLGYSLEDQHQVIEFLKDICDDLDDNECMEAIDELIKEHGGLQKTEEEYQEMIEK